MGEGPEIQAIFSKPTTEEWIAKINKDLKGAKTAEELQYVVDNGLTLDAVQAYAAQDLNPITRDRDHLVAVHVDTHSSGCNHTIRELLNIGVNTIILDAYSDVSYADILKDVILDYIQLIVHPMDELAEQTVLDHLHAVSADMGRIYSPSTKRNLIHVSYQGSVISQLSDLLQQVSDTSANELVIVIDGQKDFLSEVSKIRAAHILLANLNAALDKEIKYSLLSRTKANDEEVHELIQSSYMSLAAIIGEADGIVSVVIDPKYRLNTVHTFNLLTMESYLGKVSDPAAGSNLIEEMTELICQESWKKFQEHI